MGSTVILLKLSDTKTIRGRLIEIPPILDGTAFQARLATSDLGVDLENLLNEDESGLDEFFSPASYSKKEIANKILECILHTGSPLSEMASISRVLVWNNGQEFLRELAEAEPLWHDPMLIYLFINDTCFKIVFQSNRHVAEILDAETNELLKKISV